MRSRLKYREPKHQQYMQPDIKFLSREIKTYLNKLIFEKR